MKTLFKIILALIAAILLTILVFGCNPAKRCAKCPQTIKTDSIRYDSISYITRDSLVILPPDSNLIEMLLKCDSIGNVYIDYMKQQNGRRITTKIIFKDNLLQIKSFNDSISILNKIIERNEKHSLKATKLTTIKVYECVSWWHTFFKWGFIIESCLLILILIFLFLKWKYYDALPFTKIN